MNDWNEQHMDPWERDSYTTGSTNPPKSRKGLVAFLLVTVILLCGITTALGVANVRLFQQLNHEDSMSFFTGADASQPVPSVGDPVIPSGNDINLDLHPTPTEEVEDTSGQLSYERIYEKNIASVVSIICTTDAGTSTGTGVVLSENGYIVTNAHVISGARSIQVLLTDGRELGAGVVGQDAVSDLAVLYVDADDLTPAEFGDSSQLKVGQRVAAIGDPLGPEFRGTMTDGIVSAINRDVTTGGRTMTLIQTNAALNSGNSGGPLINAYGQVVGINTLKIGAFVDSAGVEGLGFAIPSTTVKEIVDQLVSQGYVSGRPELGFQFDSVSDEYRWYWGLPAGALVTYVPEGGAAAQAGLESNDIILTFNGQRIESGEDLSSALYACQAGQTVQLTLYRYRTGSQHAVKLTLCEADG